MIGGPAMWWIASGIVLVGAEILLPGVYAIWIGFAAIAAGLVIWGFPMSFSAQLMLFTAFAFASIWVGRRVQKSQQEEVTDSPNLHDLNRLIQGRTGKVEIVPGRDGKVLQIDGTLWRLKEPAPDIGTKVRVVQVESGELLVEALS
jgi:inner membrane protein